MPMKQALHEVEQHLLRAEAEMARAAKILESAKADKDSKLSQLADVVSTHSHIVGQLATIAGSTLASAPRHRTVSALSTMRLTQAV